MLLFNHKVISTIIDGTTPVYSSPDLYRELSQADRMVFQIRGSRFLQGGTSTLEVQYSSDGSQFQTSLSKTFTIAANATEFKVENGGFAVFGPLCRIAVYTTAGVSGFVEIWACGRARRSTVMAMARARQTGDAPSPLRLASASTESKRSSHGGARQSPSSGSVTRIRPQAPLMRGTLGVSKPGCRCGGCRSQATDLGTVLPIGRTDCNFVAARPAIPPLESAPPGAFRRQDFSESDYAVLLAAWDDADRATPLPSEGIDPSSGAPWATVEVSTVDVYRETIDTRLGALSRAVEPRTIRGSGGWRRAVETALRNHPGFAGMSARLAATGALELGDSSASAIATWMELATFATVCYSVKTNIVPRGAAVTDLFDREPEFQSLPNVAGFYLPPRGYWTGERSLDVGGLPVEFEPPRGTAPCAPGFCRERAPIAISEWQQLEVARGAAYERVRSAFGVADAFGVRAEDWNPAFLEEWRRQVQTHCPTCAESLTAAEIDRLITRVDLRLEVCGPYGLPAGCGHYEQMHGANWQFDPLADPRGPDYSGWTQPFFRCVRCE